MSFKVKINISKKLESNFPTLYEHFRDGKLRGGSKIFLEFRFSHRRNPRDFYPLHFFERSERSVADRNPVGSDDAF